MAADDPSELRFRQNLILSAVHILSSQRADRKDMFSAPVLQLALEMAGARDKRLAHFGSECFHGYTKSFRRFQRWYDTLIAMTNHEPPTERLLVGHGNLHPEHPAGAMFTKSELTELGRARAIAFLEANPKYLRKVVSA